MALESFLFNKSNSTNDDKIYLNILSFLEPKNFEQTVKLSHFFSSEPKQAKNESVEIAKSLDEIKKATTRILDKKDIYFTSKVDRMSGGLTNACYKVKTPDKDYFLRVPGKGSEDHLSREDEDHNIKIASALGFNIEIFFFNAKSGLYLGDFIEDATAITPELLMQQSTMTDVATIFKTLHSSPQLFKNNGDIFTRLKDLIKKIDERNHTWLHNRDELIQKLDELQQICMHDTSEFVACHNDPTYLNFLYKGKKLMLLDWEYSGNNKAMFDLANFALTSALTAQSTKWLLEAYYKGNPPNKLMECFEAYKQLTNIWYYLWAELQIANNSNVVPLEELEQLAHKHWDATMDECRIELKI